MPEYIIFLNILTIISAGMILPAETILKNSIPIAVFLSFSSLINELTSRLLKLYESCNYVTILFLSSLLEPPDLTWTTYGSIIEESCLKADVNCYSELTSLKRSFRLGYVFKKLTIFESWNFLIFFERILEGK